MQELDIKEHFHYDHTDEESIMARARMLEGKTLRFVSENSPYEEEAFKKSNKGNIGNFVEKHWFGILNNSNPAPDFEEAGIELKVCPIKRSSGALVTDQRTKICSIDFFKLYDETWESSHVKNKLNKVLFIFYQRKEEHEDLYDKKVLGAALWELSKQDRLDTIVSDWHTAYKVNIHGMSHELSETFFDILSTSRTTGGKTIDGENDMVKQPNTNFESYVKKRAFSLKQSFTKQFWQEYKKPESFESIVESLNVSKTKNFEDELMKSFAPYIGKDIGEIAERFEIPIPSSKSAVATIVKKMIGFKSVKSKIKEFEQLGILVKTVPIKTSDNSLFESISFPKFLIREFTNENWDESTFSNYINRILFVPVSREKKKGVDIKDRVLEKPFFWSPSTSQLKLIIDEWEMYKTQASEKLVIYEKPWDNKKGYIEQITNLSNEKETKIIHIRPHAQNSKDRDVDNFGTSVIKQSFWLNKKFVKKLVIDTLIE
jgi:DNA mismatch repair protein MutH